MHHPALHRLFGNYLHWLGALLQVDHGASLLSLSPVASLVGAAAALGLSSALYQRLERRFVFTNYIHAEK